MDSIVVALIGLVSAATGGVAVKLVEYYALPKSKQVDVASQIRDELREDAVAYREEVKALRSEIAVVRSEAQKREDKVMRCYEDLYKKYNKLTQKVENVEEQQKLLSEVTHPDDL